MDILELTSVINEQSSQLINSLVDGTHTLDVFSKLFNNMNKIDNIELAINLDENLLDDVYSVYNTISLILRSVPAMGALLIDIGDDYYHQHTNKDTGKKYTCIYHLEKLQAHILMASIISCHESIANKLGNKLTLKNTVTALFHDVGKKRCCIYNKDGAIGYPFHGEMGCGIMLNVWCSELENFFTQTEWQDMCRTISVHMCGYHETDRSYRHTQYKWKLLSLENNNVKEHLVTLSMGDHFAGIKSKKAKEDALNYVNSRKDFRESIFKDFDWVKFKQVNNFDGFMLIYRVSEKIRRKMVTRFRTIMTCPIYDLDDIANGDPVQITNDTSLVLVTSGAYSENMEQSLPDCFKNKFRFVIDVVYEKQFDSPFGWIPKEQSGMFKNLSSISTGYSVTKDLKKYKLRPHLVHVNVIKPDTVYNLDEIWRQVRILDTFK